MKKNLFYLLAFVCTASLFTACSDDDDNGWQELPKGDIKAENVDLTLNGAATTGTVSFTATGNNTAEVALKNVIDGFSALTVDVTMEKQADGAFKFNGKKSVATKPVTKTVNTPAPYLEVAVEGTIDADGKAVMKLSATGPGLYIGTYSGETLVLTYGDAPVVGKTVVLDASTGEDASLLLLDVIPGEEETTLTGISFSDAGFSGSAETSTKAKIEYTGSRKDKVLTLNLKVTKPDAKGWAGTYALANVAWGDIVVWKNPFPTIIEGTLNTIASSAVYYDVEVQKPVYDAGQYPKPMDYISNVAGPISNYVNMYPIMIRSLGGAMLYQVLQSVTLNADGNITASYSSQETKFDMNWSTSAITPDIEKELTNGRQWQDSPKNLAYWFEKDGKLYVKLNIGAIVAQAMSDKPGMGETISAVIEKVLQTSDVAGIKTLIGGLASAPGMEKLQIIANLSDETLGMVLDWVKNGVPLNVEAKDGHTIIYLDKEVFSKIVAELPLLIPLVKEMIPGTQGNFLAGILDTIVVSWKYVDKFNIGLDLKKN